MHYLLQFCYLYSLTPRFTYILTVEHVILAIFGQGPPLARSFSSPTYPEQAGVIIGQSGTWTRLETHKNQHTVNWKRDH